MKSSVVKRSIVIDGHKTSVSLEDPFWTELKKIAHTRQVTLSELVTTIEDTREQSNLSSAIRLFVLHHFQDKRMDVAKPQVSAVAAERTRDAISSLAALKDGRWQFVPRLLGLLRGVRPHLIFRRGVILIVPAHV